MTPDEIAKAMATGMAQHASDSQKAGEPEQHLKLAGAFGKQAGGAVLQTLAAAESGGNSTQKEMKLMAAGIGAMYNGSRAIMELAEAFRGPAAKVEGPEETTPATGPTLVSSILKIPGLSGGPGGAG